MARQRRLGEIEFGRQIARAHGAFAQQFEDFAPDGVGQRIEDVAHRFAFLSMNAVSAGMTSRTWVAMIVFFALFGI